MTNMPIIKPGRWPSAAYKAGYEQAVLDAVEAVMALDLPPAHLYAPSIRMAAVAAVEALGGESK